MEFKNKINIIQNLIRSKNFSIAIINCKKLLKKYPDNSYTLNLCGLALQGDKKFSMSLQYFYRALATEPENTAALNNLANTHKALYNYDKAEEIYLRLLQIDPNNFKVLNNYANLKQSLNNFEGAIELFLKAQEIRPQEPVTLFGLSASYQSVGDFEKSKEIAYEILKLDHKKTSAHKLISGYTKYKDRNEEHLGVMEKLLQEDLTDPQKIDLFFALGKAYEDIKDYKKSFEYLDKANFIKRKTVKYEIKNEEKVFNGIIKSFDQINFSEFKKTPSSRRIIFIVGMPRSGTSLIEQILSSHSNIYGAGELPYLENIMKNEFFENNNLSINKLHNLNENKVLKTIGDHYVSLINKYNYNENLITDKAPLNFRWIGLIKLIFPNSKIIHCSRAPKDNCLSLYKNIFDDNLDWTYDEDDLSNYYQQYNDLMKFWKKNIPGFIYDINYENLIADPQNQIKDMLSFCNLKWEQNCIEFHKNKRAIKTVSSSQARSKIYSSSINSYKNYQKFLAKLNSSLDKI